MSWDKNKPAAGTSLRASNPEMLGNNSSLETALNREHEFSTGGTAADQIHHRRGSARAYFQDGTPATRSDGSAFNSEDLGSLWFKSNSSPDNQFHVLTTTSPTWTPVSDEIIAVLLAAARVFTNTLGVTGDFAVNTDKFTVAASSGDTLVAGTLGVTGVMTTTAASVLGDGSTLAAATESGDGDRTIADKAFVDTAQASATETAITTGGLTGAISSATTSFSKVITHPGGMIEIIGYEKEVGVSTIDISGASFSGIYTCQLTAYDTQAAADRAIYMKALTLTQIEWEIGAGDTELEGVMYHVIGY